MTAWLTPRNAFVVALLVVLALVPVYAGLMTDCNGVVRPVQVGRLVC